MTFEFQIPVLTITNGVAFITVEGLCCYFQNFEGIF